MSERDRIRSFIQDSFFLDAIDDDASFLANGTLDSLGIMQLVAFVESEFGVKVGEADLVPDNFDSVARVASYVERARAGG